MTIVKDKYDEALLILLRHPDDPDKFSAEYIALAFIRWIYPIGFIYKETLLKVAGSSEYYDNDKYLDWKWYLYHEYPKLLEDGYYENKVSLEHIQKQKELAWKIYERYKELQ